MNKSAIFVVGYNKEDDLLFIHSKKGKSKESVEISDDIILDIDKENRLVGIEFLYASEFFRALNKEINKEILENLEEIKIDMKRYRNYLWISLSFEFNGKLIKEKLPAFSLKEYESPLIASVAS